MDTKRFENPLPTEVLKRASLSGNEYAWRVDDIPAVIEAARMSNAISIGGQLQFRLPFPHEGTCECYWVEVDTYKSVDKTLPWHERVSQTAKIALRDFEALLVRYDFLAEGRVAFGPYLDAMAAQGLDPADSMCFVWYVRGEEEVRARGW